MPHRIALGRPWRLLQGSSSEVQILRSFNCPTGLAAEQPIWLRVAWLTESEPIDIQLNGQSLLAADQTIGGVQSQIKGAGQTTLGQWTFNIASLLKPSNRLVIRLSGNTLNLRQNASVDRIDPNPALLVHLEME